MKNAYTIFALLIGMLMVAAAGCARRGEASADMPNPPPPSDEPRVAAQLPDQQAKGLLATANFRQLHLPNQFSHTLDLRLTNREGSSKMNVSVEQVNLSGFMTYFVPAPTTTLWTRGSSVDYPAIASWKLPPGLRAQAPLEVVVRFEDPTGKGVIAKFKWEVTIEPYEAGGLISTAAK